MPEGMRNPVEPLMACQLIGAQKNTPVAPFRREVNA